MNTDRYLQIAPSYEAPTTVLPLSPSSDGRTIGLGVIGLGQFGRFCLEAYMDMPGVRIVAVADVDPLALAAGHALAPDALAFDDASAVLARPEVEVVAICATPDRHLALVLAAVFAGKHVVCDKPLGVSLNEFDSAVAAAAAHNVALGVNLVLRHHPLYGALRTLSASGVLGRPRRVAVENYADEGVGFPAGHWLWNPAQSGGLALAADVHWFDLAARLLGPAYEINAWEAGLVEGVGSRRLATTFHAQGAVASIFHAFDTRPQATGCTVLAAFDEGEARVEGWIPTKLTVNCPGDRVAAVAALLASTAIPMVTLEDDGRAVLVLTGGEDRRCDYLEMIRTTLRGVIEQAATGIDNNDLRGARLATLVALAAEQAAMLRTPIQIVSEEGLEATG